MKKKLFGLIAAGLLTAIATPAMAVTIDFGTGLGGEGGTITVNGSNATGANIRIGLLTVSGAPQNSGSYLVTGACGSAFPAIQASTGCLSFDTAANTISIVGMVTGLGINTSTTLLTGSFTSWAVDSGQGLVRATGPDTKAAILLRALGMDPAATEFNFFGFSLRAQNGNAISTDIKNTTVPEPGTLALLGLGLFGVGLTRRKKSS